MSSVAQSGSATTAIRRRGMPRVIYRGQIYQGRSGGRPTRVGTTIPTVTYTPAGVAREPGFFNPSNPFDTGRHGEQNKESLKGAPGEQASWWDYDLGKPKQGVLLNAAGFYGSTGAPSGGQGVGSGMAGGGLYDYSGDPVLQEALLDFAREEQAARSRLLEGKRRTLLQLGSRSVAERILGASDPTLAGIVEGPQGTSDFSRILKAYNDMLRGVEEQTSMGNTFFGTGRANAYTEAAYQRQQSEADRVFGAESQIQGFQDAFDNVMREIMIARRQMEQNAYYNNLDPYGDYSDYGVEGDPNSEYAIGGYGRSLLANAGSSIYPYAGIRGVRGAY